MNRLVKRACSLTVAMTMFATMPSNVVMADTNENSTSYSDNLKQIYEELKQTVEEDSKVTKESYKEGEAIIMYYGSQASANTRATSPFGSKIKIKKTWNFSKESSQKSMSKSTSSNNTKELLVSKVSSSQLSTEEMIQQLSQNSSVKYAEPNYICHIASEEFPGNYSEYQWSLNNTGQNNGTENSDLNPEKIWKDKKGTEKVIAVVDTGIDYTHPDLKKNMWDNPYEDSLPGKHGYDFANQDDDPIDDNGHGSHCAGIIAGSGNGISGVNHTAKLMAVKALNSDGGGTLADLVDAYAYINKALDLGVDIVSINNSWSAIKMSKIFYELIEQVGEKGAITVNAAGNESMNHDLDAENTWSFPSEYRISVAASNGKDELADFSNYGKKTVDLAAPGTDILSSVSYDIYNPTIHEKENDYSELYYNFNEVSDLKNIETFGSVKADNVRISICNEDNFGLPSKNAGVLCCSVTVDKPGFCGFVLPVTLPKSSTDYYISASKKLFCKSVDEEGGVAEAVLGFDEVNKVKRLGIDYNFLMTKFNLLGTELFGSKPNYWGKVNGNTKIKESKDNQYGLWYAFLALTPGTYEVYLDNIGISKKDMKPSQFGKYDFYNGTSMAAPQVAGAVALLSELYPELEASELRDLIVQSVRKSDALTNKTISGGVLDLSKATSDCPLILNTKASKQTIVIQGKNFAKEKGQVKLNGKDAKILAWSNDEITIANKDIWNEKAKIKVTKADSTTIEKECYISYSQVTPIEVGRFDKKVGGKVATDGNDLYYIDDYGKLYQYKEKEWTEKSVLLPSIIDDSVNDELYTIFNSRTCIKSQIIYYNGAFYGIGQLDGLLFTAEALVKYDLATNTWSKVRDIPEELLYIEEFTLACYQDKLYFLGGYDNEQEEVSGTVYTYDLKDDNAELVKMEQSMPKRFGAVAATVNNKLVVSLGGDGTNECPNTIVFDGKRWIEPKQESIETSGGKSYITGSGEELTYYDAQVVAFDNYLVYTDLLTDNYGDVFAFNTDTNQYERSPYSLYEYSQAEGGFLGTLVGNQFMFLVNNKVFAAEITK